MHIRLTDIPSVRVANLYSYTYMVSVRVIIFIAIHSVRVIILADIISVRVGLTDILAVPVITIPAGKPLTSAARVIILRAYKNVPYGSLLLEHLLAFKTRTSRTSFNLTFPFTASVKHLQN
jgi:hypothetical protein